MSKAKILIVDDEPDIVVILRRVLEVNGYEVSVVTTGKGALERNLQEDFDLILLDITLPDISGYEVCSKLKKDTPRKIPVLLLSARAQQSDLDRGFEAGADGYITKPFDPFQLVNRIGKTLIKKVKDEST